MIVKVARKNGINLMTAKRPATWLIASLRRSAITEPPYVSRGQAIVAALKSGPMSFQALAREINCPPSSLPQFLEPLLAKGIVIRTEHGVYALRGSAPLYVPTCDAIISALTKKAMKLGQLVLHVTKLTKSTRSAFPWFESYQAASASL
jgi:predicted transcriptional regulator